MGFDSRLRKIGFTVRLSGYFQTKLGTNGAFVSTDRFDTQFLRKPHEFGYRLRAELLREAAPMSLDCTLSRTQIKGDLFVQLTAHDMGHHFSLSRG